MSRAVGLRILCGVATFRGTVRHSDLEGGVWQLEADDGEIYELEGAGGWEAHVDARVEIDGKVDQDALSFTMTGPRLKVTAVRAA